MSVGSLERRIVQMLCCDPNRPILEQIVKKECNINFRYVATEFPILTEDGYGFLDIVGKNEKRDSIVLLECKPDPHLMAKATKEAEYYKKSLDLYGLFQKENLIGLYHRAVFGEVSNLRLEFNVEPLILDESKLLSHSGLSFRDLLTNYRTFMLEWISSTYQISSENIAQVIPIDAIPIYLVDRLENNRRNSYVGFYGLKQRLSFAKLNAPIVDTPLKLEPDKTTYETMRKIERSKGSRRFAVQFHRHGHSRPMLFLEIDDHYSVCFIHTGKNQVELNGYYESAKVLGGTERIYGLIQAETGRFAIKESNSNILTLEIYGRRCNGEIKLNFLDEIYIDNDITLTSVRQTTLENH